MTGAQLVDLFIGEQTTADEIARMNVSVVERRIAELRRDEPDDISMTDYEIAKAIWRYARYGDD